MKQQIDNDIKNLVISRLEAYSDDMDLSLGDLGTFSTEELIRGVKEDSEIGHKIVEIEVQFLRDLVNGKLYKEIE